MFARNRTERTEKRFDYRVAVLVCFPLDELNEHLSLRLGEFFEHRLVLVENGRFHSFEIILALFLCRKGFNILICFKQSGTYEFGIWKSFFTSLTVRQ